MYLIYTCISPRIACTSLVYTYTFFSHSGSIILISKSPFRGVGGLCGIFLGGPLFCEASGAGCGASRMRQLFAGDLASWQRLR